jgi:hypothetical protein
MSKLLEFQKAVKRVQGYSRKELFQAIARSHWTIKRVGQTEVIRRKVLDRMFEIYKNYLQRQRVEAEKASKQKMAELVKQLEELDISDIAFITQDSTRTKVTPSVSYPATSFNELLSDQLKNIKSFPVHVRTIAQLSDGNPTNNIQRKEKLAFKLSSKNDIEKYTINVADNIFRYEFTQQYPNHHVTSAIVEITDSKDRTILRRVAKYQAENCVVNIIRGYIGDKADAIYEKFPDLKPQPTALNAQNVQNEDFDIESITTEQYEAIQNTQNVQDPDFIYVDSDKLNQIAKTLGLNIVTYTELGALNNRIWQSFGYNNRKKVHMKVACEHAVVMPGKLKVMSYEYPKFINIPSTTDIVDCDYFYPENPGDEPMPKYYTKLINGELKMHKSFRPSSITNNLADDSDIKYSYVFTPEQMMYRLFKSKYNLSPISNPTLRTIAKCAEHFIGKRVLEPLESLDKYTEYDHNKNYCAYETSQYYQGFPTNKLFPVKPEFSVNPAFIVCTIHNAPRSFQLFYNYVGQSIVITHPVYKCLLNLGAEIIVDYILDAEFQDISIMDFANSLPVTDDDKKKFRNQLIGRTITGGLIEAKTVNCRYNCDEERNQIIHECQQLGYNFADNGGVIVVECPNRTAGFFNFHSYILGYAATFMMHKWAQLEADGKHIVAYNVDAIVVQGKYHEHTDEIGGWKTSVPKKYYSYFNVSGEIKPVLREIPQITMPDREIPRVDTVINGAAGISKSYPWVNDPAFDQVILTPTRELRNEHKMRFDNTYTAHKYFGLNTPDDKTFEILRAKGLIPREYSVVVVDERTMFDESEWDTIQRRKGNSTIITLGDSAQIRNEINGTGITMKWFQDNNYIITQIHRIEGNPARHTYEHGCKLDRLRYKNFDTQRALIAEMFPDQIIPLNVRDLDITVDRIICGDHVTVNRYNNEARNITPEGGLFPFRTTGKIPKTVLLPVNTDGVFWDRKKLTDKRPKGTKYEPYFAVTPDSFQGKTVDSDIYVVVDSLQRHGCLYTAATRTRSEYNTWFVI